MRIKRNIFQPLKLAFFGLLTFGFIGFNADKAEAVAMNMETGLGSLSVNVDTTASAGVQVRLKNVDPGRVASQSGGNDGVRYLNDCPALPGAAISPGLTGLTVDSLIIAGAGIVSNCLGNNGIFGFKQTADKNFAGGQNSDDGRLNFQNTGDITGATFKILTEVQASLASPYGDVTFFTRINAFYDPVLHADFGLDHHNRAYDRGEPSDAGRRELGKDLTLLDISLSWDYDIPAGSFIGTIPISLKVGKLAANNWGEATFSFTGISQGVVLDVPAARRPGAQIKEIIGTEYMVYGSVGLPFDIGLDAYYQFHHTPWSLSPSDAPFAISDIPNPSNDAATYLGLSGGATGGTFRRNCDATGGILSGVLGACDTSSIRHYENTYYATEPRARAEDVRLREGDLLRARVSYVDADNQGQFGVQLSYYVPFLNGFEFNFSYQNVHSRLPYARVKTDGVPVVTGSVISGSSGLSTNALNGLGCTGVNPAFAAASPAFGGYLATGSFIDPTLQGNVSGDTTTPGYRAPGGVIGQLNPQLAGPTAGAHVLQDPNNLKLGIDTAHFGGEATGTRIGLGDEAVFFSDDPDQYNDLTRGAGNRIQQLAAAADQVLTAAASAAGWTHTLIATNITTNGLNRFDVARINCAIFAAQPKYDTTVATLISPQLAVLGALSPVGTEYLGLQYNVRTDLFYPQNLKIIGMGFNTTIPWLDWGLQAEIAWRPDTPLQQDVTEQLIGHASGQGTGSTLGDTAALALAPLVTTGGDGTNGLTEADTNWIYSISNIFVPGAAADPGTGLFASTFNPNVIECFLSGECGGNGIVEADMLNITIGTTALYNGSHPVVRLLGADLGVFLLELNVITFLDGIPDGWDGGSNIARGAKHSTLACVRKSGTELPLGGLVGLDTVDDFSCTPDETSLGYTIFGFLDYNNVFGTAWRIRPSLAIRHGAYGNTPSPLPGWRQDAISVNAGLGFAYQNTWDFSLGYVGYFDVGDHGNYNSNTGLDTFSFSASYAF